MLKSFSADKLLNDLSKIEDFEDILRKPMARQHLMFALSGWNEILEKIREHARQNGITADPFRGMSEKLLDNPKLFFKHWEKVFDRRGDELFRKLTRLYAAL